MDLPVFSNPTHLSIHPGQAPAETGPLVLVPMGAGTSTSTPQVPAPVAGMPSLTTRWPWALVRPIDEVDDEMTRCPRRARTHPEVELRRDVRKGRGAAPGGVC